ncbi:MAG: hypothetical protein ACRDRW_20010 [Pseudonocardiaceae bacterium]
MAPASLLEHLVTAGRDERTGFPVMRLGGAPITVEDVRALDDDE